MSPPLLRHLTSALLVAALAAACSPAAAKSSSSPATPTSRSTTTVGLAPMTVPPLPNRPAVLSTGPVFLLGDSLTVGIEPYLATLLPGRQVRFDAKVGRTTDQGIAIVKKDPGQLASTVVVGLGTNDETTAAEFAQNVDLMMALLGNRRVLWVNVARKGFSDFDAVLVAATEKYQNLELVDWASTYYSSPKVQATDGIHATEAGYQLRAQIIAAALSAPSPAIEP